MTDTAGGSAGLYPVCTQCGFRHAHSTAATCPPPPMSEGAERPDARSLEERIAALYDEAEELVADGYEHAMSDLLDNFRRLLSERPEPSIPTRDCLIDVILAATWGYRGAHAGRLADAILAHLNKHPEVERDRPWRCFHCDDVFTTEREAREHFGISEISTPACLIKGSEGGLVRALREAEADAAKAWQALGSEIHDAANAYHAFQARHASAVQNAEEVGYARGLRDAGYSEVEREPDGWGVEIRAYDDEAKRYVRRIDEVTLTRGSAEEAVGEYTDDCEAEVVPLFARQPATPSPERRATDSRVQSRGPSRS